MSDLDFSKPAPAPQPPKPVQPPPFYNAAVAMDFFRSGGKAESYAQGATIFAEDDKGGGLFGKRDRMFLLLSGEVEMHAQGKPIGMVRVGEIFGEMAAIAQAARTATAVAKTACTVIGMDDKQFQSMLQQKPEFSLMMMSVINSRLRSTISRLQASRTLHAGEARESSVFDKKTLAALVKALGGDRATVRCEAGKMIMQEGTTGNVMYVVLEGRVGLSIKGGVVGRAGPGGVFGEMALVDQAPRAATAVAASDCMLLCINRADFLALVKSKPEFGTSLLRALAERLRFLTSHYKQ
jgi:CRP/FNR family transcriptional regulator, cyclic AMP receptor protein